MLSPLESAQEILVTAVIRNISGRKEAETALRTSEMQYRRLFEAARDGILILDADTGLIVDVNPFLVDLLGYSHGDFLKKRLWEIGSFRDLAASEDAFRELQARKYIRYDDLPLRTADGHLISVEFVSNVYEVNGQQLIQCNIRDITERKRDQEERSRLILAVEQAADSIWITDTDGRIVYVNPAFERVTGYKREEAIGQTPRILKSGKHGVSFYEEMWGTLLKGNVWSSNVINKRKDGSLYEQEGTITPVRDASGRIVNYLAVKRDVSREKQLEEQLRQAQKMEAVGQLAGGIAHDFNNLLMIISGYSELMVEKTASDVYLNNAASQIKEAADRAGSLTSQLLAFSRRQTLQPKILDLNRVLANLEKMLRRVIGEHIELVIAPAPDLGHVLADPSQMEQVLMNLAVNARDAMPKGGKLVIESSNVELDEEYFGGRVEMRPGSYARLAVSDTGIGMDLATQDRIFEPFFTTKKLGEGTGLGLSTVYGIVKQSGGYVWVYSEPAHGTTFKIYLPRVDTPVKEESRQALTTPAGGTETILLVEDEGRVRKFIGTLLRSKGYTVLEAGNGVEGIEVSEQYGSPIHLLLTDMVMPKMSGPEFAERLAHLRPGIKVLFMSGYANPAVGGIIAENAAFLQKPATATALMLKIRDVLT